MSRPAPIPSSSPRPDAPGVSVQGFYAQSRTALWLGRAMRLAGRVAPDLALRAAVRLFFTPLPTKRVARARAVPPGWRVEHLPFEQGRLALWRHPSDDGSRARVLLVHGWAGHAQQMTSLAEAVAAQGLAPVLVEFPGHGRSDGWRSTLPQFVRALFAVQARLGPWRAVVGHSLGALAAAHAAARGLAVDRLVLVSAPMPPAVVLEGFAQAFGLPATLPARMRQRIEASEGVPLQAFEPDWLAQRVSQPTLVVHDADDRAAPSHWAHRLAQALPAAHWLSTRGLGHRRLLDDAQVKRSVAGFAASRDGGPIASAL